MTEHAARLVMDRLHMRPSHLAPQYADPVGASKLLPGTLMPMTGSTLAADLRDFAMSNKEDLQASFDARMVEMAGEYGFRATAAPSVVQKPYAFQDGVAIIPVHGMLINRFSYSWGFMTGYTFIRNMLQAALADDDVTLMAFDVNSFGGTAAGLPELSKEIFDSRAIKPSIAVIDPFCYSAAYFVASSCSKVVCTPSGGAGSIGTVLTHTSYQGALKEAGIEVTQIFAGDHKVDGNSYQNLTADVKAGLQALVDENNDGFISAVARNRGLSEADVRATQAQCYSAIDAKQLDLIDAVEVSSDAIGWFLSASAGDSDEEDDVEMTTAVAQPAPTAAAAAPAPVAQPAQAAGLTAADVTAAVQSALKADRDRRVAITQSEEAKGRGKLAQYFADSTDMSVEAARAALGNAATEAEPAANGNGRSNFSAAMDTSRNPNVGADAPAAGGAGGADAQQAKQARRDAAKNGAFGPAKRSA